MAAIFGALLASKAGAQPAWNNRAGTYFDELDDGSGMETMQALTFGSSSVGITPAWYWNQPSAMAGATSLAFSVRDSVTSFSEIEQATGANGGENVKLLQKFFSARQQMEWGNDCPSGDSTDVTCLVYPFVESNPLLGARSREVLLVPDVGRFNDEQISRYLNAKNPPPPNGSGDFTVVALNFAQNLFKDFIKAGKQYSATWFIRSPGQHPSPGCWLSKDCPATSYNQRLVGFKIGFTYSHSGGAGIGTDFLGGANDPTRCDSGDPSMMPGGCLMRTVGCPVRISLSWTEPGSATLYLNNPGYDPDAPFTPFSFWFSPGGIAGLSATSYERAFTCEENANEGMNYALCRRPPDGAWSFSLVTIGAPPAAKDDETRKCPSSSPNSSGLADRASASLFVDGLMLTAGDGLYISPKFDGLSPYTVWNTVAWQADLNPNDSGNRTPIKFVWRVGNDTSNWTSSSTAFTGWSMTAPVEAGTTGFAAQGRYFQYMAVLTSWDQNRENPPPPVNRGWGVPCGTSGCYCLRYDMQHDASLSPRLKSFAAGYQADAGMFVSLPIHPSNMRSWKKLVFEKSGDQVVADVLGPDGNPAVTLDGAVLAGVNSGVLLDRVNPGTYPALKVRFTLMRNNNPAADPRVSWFRLEYAPMTEFLVLNRNALRLSRGETVDVRFSTGASGMVDVKIHDVSGQLVKRVFRGELKAGVICQKSWNGTSDRGTPPANCDSGGDNLQGDQVAPGIYFVTSITPSGRQTVRVAVTR